MRPTFRKAEIWLGFLLALGVSIAASVELFREPRCGGDHAAGAQR